MYDPKGDQCVCVIVGGVYLAYAALSQVPYRRWIVMHHSWVNLFMGAIV